MPVSRIKHGGERRRHVPSSEPMPGVDEGPIEAGAPSGAQLPEKTDIAQPAAEVKRGKRRKPGLNPNQGDLFKDFWVDE